VCTHQSSSNDNSINSGHWTSKLLLNRDAFVVFDDSHSSIEFGELLSDPDFQMDVSFLIYCKIGSSSVVNPKNLLKRVINPRVKCWYCGDSGHFAAFCNIKPDPVYLDFESDDHSDNNNSIDIDYQSDHFKSDESFEDQVRPFIS
jgi:hypothetical protein